MLSLKRNSLAVFCMLLVGCQKVDLAVDPEVHGAEDAEARADNIVGTGEGTAERPYTVKDIRSKSLSGSEPVWTIGYMVGTAARSMSNALFIAEADNRSNILLSSDSLCNDTARCIPVELSSDKWKAAFSLPANVEHFRKCLIVKAVPSRYLNRKGLRSVSAGLWIDGFDLAAVTPNEWGNIVLH